MGMMRNSLCFGALLVIGAFGLPTHAQVSGEGGPIRVKADKSEVLDRERKLILIDNVDITQGTARLRADIVTLAYADNGSGSPGLGSNFGDIRSMTAQGDVFYITPELKANGALGIYDAETNTITVTGDVVLLRGEDVAKGERLIINLTEGKTVLDGGSGNQVNMVINPEQTQTGAETDAPADPEEGMNGSASEDG